MLQRILASTGRALTDRPFFFYLGTVALTYMFWWSGLTKLFDFAGAQGEMAHFGLNPPWFFAAATIVVQLGGSALVIFGGRLAWCGAGVLALFTLGTIPIAHDFWNLTGQAAFVEKLWSQEHVSVVGGLVVAAILASLRWERTTPVSG
ncbi:MAG TPA: DoxX family protein [Gemmatimonadales bacterium]|nr:DoxX family protein [Gemmatimonadales bacterium]